MTIVILAHSNPAVHVHGTVTAVRDGFPSTTCTCGLVVTGSRTTHRPQPRLRPRRTRTRPRPHPITSNQIEETP